MSSPMDSPSTAKTAPENYQLTYSNMTITITTPTTTNKTPFPTPQTLNHIPPKSQDQVPSTPTPPAIPPTQAQIPFPTPTPNSQPVENQDPKQLILTSPLPPHQKSVLLALLQIPPGSVTTYALLAKHLRSSPRAVGNALRRNPFAPLVPCHRVVASDKTLGGFKGKIGSRDGEGCLVLEEKRMLLKREGVKFRESRVVGSVWGGFV